MISQTGYCRKWGAKMGAREVFGLTAEEKQRIKNAPGSVMIGGAPAYRGITTRVVIYTNGRYFARMPS